jgi:hypothetical protein
MEASALETSKSSEAPSGVDTPESTGGSGVFFQWSGTRDRNEPFQPRELVWIYYALPEAKIREC